MTLDLTADQVIILLIPQITLLASFIIYAKVEIGVMKTRITTIEKQAENDSEQRTREYDDLKSMYKELNKKFDTMQETHSRLLYDIGTKVTQVATIVKIKENDKH